MSTDDERHQAGPGERLTADQANKQEELDSDATTHSQEGEVGEAIRELAKRPTTKTITTRSVTRSAAAVTNREASVNEGPFFRSAPDDAEFRASRSPERLAYARGDPVTGRHRLGLSGVAYGRAGRVSMRLRVSLALFVVGVVAVSAAVAAGPPLPKAANGQMVSVVARGIPTPTSIAFLGGQTFVAGFGDEQHPKVTGGVYLLKGGKAVKVRRAPRRTCSGLRRLAERCMSVAAQAVPTTRSSPGVAGTALGSRNPGSSWPRRKVSRVSTGSRLGPTGCCTRACRLETSRRSTTRRERRPMRMMSSCRSRFRGDKRAGDGSEATVAADVCTRK